MLCPMTPGLYSLELSFRGGEGGGRLFDGGEGRWFLLCPLLLLLLYGGVGGGWSSSGGGAESVADYKWILSSSDTDLPHV